MLLPAFFWQITYSSMYDQFLYMDVDAVHVLYTCFCVYVSVCLCLGALQWLYDDVGGWVTQSSPRDIMNHRTSAWAELQPSTRSAPPLTQPSMSSGTLSLLFSVPPLSLLFILTSSLFLWIFIPVHSLSSVWLMHIPYHSLLYWQPVEILCKFQSFSNTPIC